MLRHINVCFLPNSRNMVTLSFKLLWFSILHFDVCLTSHSFRWCPWFSWSSQQSPPLQSSLCFRHQSWASRDDGPRVLRLHWVPCCRLAEYLRTRFHRRLPFLRLRDDLRARTGEQSLRMSCSSFPVRRCRWRWRNRREESRRSGKYIHWLLPGIQHANSMLVISSEEVQKARASNWYN